MASCFRLFRVCEVIISVLHRDYYLKIYKNVLGYLTETHILGIINLASENKCGCSSSGRAPPCQGGGSESESRHPLQ